MQIIDLAVLFESPHSLLGDLVLMSREESNAMILKGHPAAVFSTFQQNCSAIFVSRGQIDDDVLLRLNRITQVNIHTDKDRLSVAMLR